MFAAILPSSWSTTWTRIDRISITMSGRSTRWITDPSASSAPVAVRRAGGSVPASSPDRANAEKARTICTGVTATSWPKDTDVCVNLLQAFRGVTTPAVSPGRPIPVAAPKPKRWIAENIWSKLRRSAPWAMPMFDDSTSTSSQVSNPCLCTSCRCRPYGVVQNPSCVSIISRGLTSPACVIVAHTNGLNVEPGS